MNIIVKTSTKQIDGEFMTNSTLSVNEIITMLYPIFETAPVYRAYLFGSYAKGSPTENSDIDIVIDSKGELLNIDFYGVLEDITCRLGKRVDLIEISEIKNNSSIISSLESDGIVLYDRQR